MVKFLITITTLFLLLSLNGCAQKEIEYVPTVVEKEVYVPYVPDLPTIECNFRGDELTLMKQMLDCVALHKKILNTLRQEKQKPEGVMNAFHNRQ